MYAGGWCNRAVCHRGSSCRRVAGTQAQSLRKFSFLRLGVLESDDGFSFWEICAVCERDGNSNALHLRPVHGGGLDLHVAPDDVFDVLVGKEDGHGVGWLLETARAEEEEDVGGHGIGCG